MAESPTPSGFLVGPNLLNDIYDLTDATPSPTRAGSVPVQGKQITYVKTTSGTATSGWYPAVVRTYSTGGHTDHAGEVEVKAANGEALEDDTAYLAVRQGPSESGTPRYVATTGGDDCDLLEVTLPAFATAASVNSAINSALGSLSFTGTVSITCQPNGTATASVTLTRSGGSPVSITGVPVTLEGCSLAIV